MKEKNTQAKTPNKKAIGLTTKIFIALIAGAILGIVLCYLVPDSSFKKDVIIEGVLYIIGQGFIRLMKMLLYRWYSALWSAEVWQLEIQKNSVRWV